MSDRGWIVSREWHQATAGEGIYEWRLWDEDALYHDFPERARVATGLASSRLGVRWQVYRALRRHGYAKSWRAFVKRSAA